jgi:hypothetical protein
MATFAKTSLSKTVQKAIATQKAPTVQTKVHVRSVISIPNLWPSDAFHVSREPTAISNDQHVNDEVEVQVMQL